MSQGFDPYHRWLGIPPREQPPHHYRLLGIPLFEDHPDVIETAAARQSSYVRKMIAGEHEALARRIVQEIDAARVCLLQPAEKAAYDALLRARLEALQEASAVSVPAGVAAQAATAEPVFDLFDSPTSSGAGGRPPPLPRSRRRSLAWPLTMLFAAVGGLTVAAVLYSQYADRGPAPVRIEWETRPVEKIAVQDDLDDDFDAMLQQWFFDTWPDAPPAVQIAKTPPPAPVPIPIATQKPGATDDGAPRRLAVPGEAEQATVRKQLDDAYPPGRARTADDKLQQVTQWLALAEKSTDTIERFVLLRKSVELSLEAGRVDTMLSAMDRLAAQYAVDTAAFREKLLVRAADGAKDAQAIESWLTAVEPLVDQAMQAGRYDAAVRLAELGARLCQQPAGVRFRRDAAARARECREFADAFTRREQALATLAKDPDNAAAHLTAGLWDCFYADDASAGWPHLAQGSDAALRALAKREIDKPSATDDVLRLGEDWIAAARQRRGPIRRAMLGRAAHWYAAAWRQSTGLAQRKVASRLADLAAAVEDERSVPPAVAELVREVSVSDVLSTGERDVLVKRLTLWGVDRPATSTTAKAGTARTDPKADRLIEEAWDAIERGDVALGRERLFQARREFRGDVRALFSLGLVDALVNHDWASAETCFVQCAKLEPSNLAVLGNRALAHLRNEHTSMALREWEALSAAGPASGEMIQNVGRYRALLSGGQLHEKPLLVRAVDDLFGRVAGPQGRGFESNRGFRWMRLPLADGRSVGFADESRMDDRWCFLCRGQGKVRCTNPECIRGAVRKTEKRTVRNPSTGADVRVPVVVPRPCSTCAGAGVIQCTTCNGSGVDRRIRNGSPPGNR